MWRPVAREKIGVEAMVTLGLDVSEKTQVKLWWSYFGEV